MGQPRHLCDRGDHGKSFRVEWMPSSIIVPIRCPGFSPAQAQRPERRCLPRHGRRALPRSVKLPRPSPRSYVRSVISQNHGQEPPHALESSGRPTDRSSSLEPDKHSYTTFVELGGRRVDLDEAGGDIGGDGRKSFCADRLPASTIGRRPVPSLRPARQGAAPRASSPGPYKRGTARAVEPHRVRAYSQPASSPVVVRKNGGAVVAMAPSSAKSDEVDGRS